MKILPVSIIETVSASSSATNYPASNLLDTHPKKIWKGTGASETLTFGIDGGSNGFFLFNTNATGVSFQLVDPNLIAWETGTAWESGVDWGVNEAGETVVSLSDLPGANGSCMATWNTISTDVSLIVTLSNEDSETLYAGLAVAGEIFSYRDPSYEGFEEGLNDFSVVSELSNGSIYYKERDIVRTFALSVLLERATDFDSFLNDVAKVVKSGPAAWAVTDENDSRWITYARFTRLPSAKHHSPDHTTVSFELTEVI